MRKVFTFAVIVSVLCTLAFMGCSPRSRYEHKLQNELASGKRNDSIFMGIYLGMADKEFYSHCWKLNKEGLVRQGASNQSVQYEMKGELRHPATMDFYPEFEDGKIVRMPVRFVYNGWAPWNKELSAEALQKDVLRWFKEVYGTGFIRVRHPRRGMAYIKIDGNRRITIYNENEVHVWAIFADMSVLEGMDNVPPVQEDIN